jgi:hypothetical protein
MIDIIYYYRGRRSFTLCAMPILFAAIYLFNTILGWAITTTLSTGMIFGLAAFLVDDNKSVIQKVKHSVIVGIFSIIILLAISAPFAALLVLFTANGVDVRTIRYLLLIPFVILLLTAIRTVVLGTASGALLHEGGSLSRIRLAITKKHAITLETPELARLVLFIMLSSVIISSLIFITYNILFNGMNYPDDDFARSFVFSLSGAIFPFVFAAKISSIVNFPPT